MVKKEASLMSDIGFIKEFEELKLKQKLLIETLKKNTQTKETKLFLDVNSKLDFLVKIFKETTSNQENEEDEQKGLESKIDELMEKISSMSDSFDKKIIEIDDKIDILVSRSKKNEVVKVSSSSMDELSVSNSIDKGSLDVKKDSKDDSLPPKPDFESNINDSSIGVDSIEKNNVKNSVSEKMDDSGNKLNNSSKSDSDNENIEKNKGIKEKKKKKKWF